jgi:hypothetical protein
LVCGSAFASGYWDLDMRASGDSLPPARRSVTKVPAATSALVG